MTAASSGRVEQVLRSIKRLRPLPANTTRLLSEVDNPESSTSSVARLIAVDQALTAYVLQVANSAYLGYSSDCTSPKDAVVRLGFKQIRSLVIGLTASGPLSQRLVGYRLGNHGLWTHSTAVAATSHWLATIFRYPDPEEAYSAGLLHDLGKLVLDQFVMADYEKIMAAMKTHDIPMWQVEEELYGMDHANVGGHIAEQWDFPAVLADAIRHHHAPHQSQVRQKLTAITNLANGIISDDSPVQLPLTLNRDIHPETLRILGIDLNGLDKIKSRHPEAMVTYQSRQLPV